MLRGEKSRRKCTNNYSSCNFSVLRLAGGGEILTKQATGLRKTPISQFISFALEVSIFIQKQPFPFLSL